MAPPSVYTDSSALASLWSQVKGLRINCSLLAGGNKEMAYKVSGGAIVSIMEASVLHSVGRVL